MSGNERLRKSRALRQAKGRGQAVVEFALMMVFFLVILLAVLDIGRAFFTAVALENAAAEGAMYGMANPTCENQGDCGDAQNSIDYRVRHESLNRLLDPAEMSFQVSPAVGDRVVGATLVVTVTYPFRPIIPLVSAFGMEEFNLTSSARQLIP